MTSCYIPQLSFSFYRHRPIRADFSGGQITSDAGLLPLRALISGMGLLAVWQNPSVILAKRSVLVIPCCRCFVNASTVYILCWSLSVMSVVCWPPDCVRAGC